MYREQTIRSMELNNDFLVSYHDTFGQLSLNASLGGNNMLYKYHNSRQTANMLEEPNVFILQNVNGTASTSPIRARPSRSIRFTGLSRSAARHALSRRDGRNDWSVDAGSGLQLLLLPIGERQRAARRGVQTA